MAPDVLVSRELKLLQDELSAAKTEWATPPGRVLEPVTVCRNHRCCESAA
jgi:hypothetical protein